MFLKKGNVIPNMIFYKKKDSVLTEFNTDDYFSNKKIIVFSVPGAFTPTCSAKHLPSYAKNFEYFKKLGIDNIACLSANDIHVMHAWIKLQKALDEIDILADPKLKFTRILGIQNDKGEIMGLRCLRTSFLVINKTIKQVFIEKDGEYRHSSAEHMISFLETYKD